jgi:hypothetical protein
MRLSENDLFRTSPRCSNSLSWTRRFGRLCVTGSCSHNIGNLPVLKASQHGASMNDGANLGVVQI